METKWLEDFVSLAETHSFSRSAQLRHVTQPAFSRRIQSLEAWAGTDLVDRSSYPTRLTPAGQTLYDQSLEMLQALQSTRAMLRGHSSAGQDFIEFAVDGAKRMQGFIHDLLLYSRVGTHGRPFERLAVGQILQRVLDNLRFAIEEKHAEVVVGEMPEIQADPVQLTQLLQNLIGNALKFSADRPLRIEIQASRRNGEWEFAVRDNGIGIDPKDNERIFVIFQRLHSRQEYEGTGLGLAIAKKIVERHGGRIWLESTPGEGTTFYFTLSEEP